MTAMSEKPTSSTVPLIRYALILLAELIAGGCLIALVIWLIDKN